MARKCKAHSFIPTAIRRYLLGLMHRGDGKAAKALAKKLLA